MSEKATRETHESYGMAVFSQRQTNGRQLFGSSVKHMNTVGLSIKEGERHRSNSEDNYWARRSIIEVEFSPSQFAALLTTMNTGSGVPCTIRYRGQVSMEDPPFQQSEMSRTRNEFKDYAKEADRRMARIEKKFEDLLANKKLPKKDREGIENLLAMLRQEMNENLVFLKDMFDEAVEKTVVEAKANVDAFVTGAVLRTGLKALRGGVKMIGLDEKDNAG